MSGVQISLPRPIRQFATGFLFWPVLADLLFEGTTFLRLALQSLAVSSDVECSLADLSSARPRTVVTVAQLVEPWTVTPVVAGSNPVSHPIFPPLRQYPRHKTIDWSPVVILSRKAQQRLSPTH